MKSTDLKVGVEVTMTDKGKNYYESKNHTKELIDNLQVVEITYVGPDMDNPREWIIGKCLDGQELYGSVGQFDKGHFELEGEL